MKKTEKMLKLYAKKWYIWVTLMLCLFFMLSTVFLTGNIFATEEEHFPQNEMIFYENQNPIDLATIIEQNLKNQMKEEMVVEEIEMEYTTKYKNNPELATGVVQVLQEGRTGKQNAVIIKKYQNDELMAEELVAENILKAPVERIVEIGTGKQVFWQEAQEKDTVYAVATSVAVRLLPDENAEKIYTLKKDEPAQILKIEGDWYFISTIDLRGYVPKDCVTTQNPNQTQITNDAHYTKQQLLQNLSFDMDLRKPSGLSLEQFKQVLADEKNDKKKVFAENAEYFYYIEKQYKINGIFVASVGIHESAWGTSQIANNKQNLFGYGAVDSNPYGGAYQFASYAEGIDLVARVFVKYYLNPKGTKLYDGSEASGKFYSGSHLTAVNSRYASDKNWANAVYKWMQYLYNRVS